MNENTEPRHFSENRPEREPENQPDHQPNNQNASWRIITRPDFDGVVCAALLRDALSITQPIVWTQPSSMQRDLVEVQSRDIIANLPYHDQCGLWFDHHYSNRTEKPFEGAFGITPSAARLVFEYYRNRFHRDYSELVMHTDKIDSADLTPDEVKHPENYPYLLLSMTINGREMDEASYWNLLVGCLMKFDIGPIMEHAEVTRRCRKVTHNNQLFKELLLQHTTVQKHVAVTDFRTVHDLPEGNRYLVYSLYPDTSVSVKIRYWDETQQNVSISVGHSIFNPTCRVNVGEMLGRFEGGGHHGAGGCSFDARKSDQYIEGILDILLKNEPLS